MYKISTELIPSKMERKRKDEISESIRSYKASDDIIAFLFASLKSETLPTNENKIHTAISKLKESYPDFFSEFVFSRGDLYPYSKELERILFRLQQSKILGTINPSYEDFILTNESKEVVVEHLTNKFSKRDRELLLEMSKKLEGFLFS